MIVGYQGNSKLKQMQRKELILEKTPEGTLIKGTKRKLRSKKSHQVQMFKHPTLIPSAKPKEIMLDSLGAKEIENGI